MNYRIFNTHLLQAIWDWYHIPGNEVGGILNIVTDDGNLEDANLEYCRIQVDSLVGSHKQKLANLILDGLQERPFEKRQEIYSMINPYQQRPVG